MVNHKKYKSLDYTNSLDRIFDLSQYSSVTLNIDCTTVPCLEFLDSFQNRVESFMSLRERIKCIKLFVESYDDVTCSLDNIWCDVDVVYASSKSISDVIISECIQDMNIGNIVITNNDKIRSRSYFPNVCFLHYRYDVFMFHHRSSSLYIKDLSTRLSKFKKPIFFEECKKFDLDKFVLCSIVMGLNLDDVYKVWNMITFPFMVSKFYFSEKAKSIGPHSNAEAIYYHTLTEEDKSIFHHVKDMVSNKEELNKMYTTFVRKDTFGIDTIIHVII